MIRTIRENFLHSLGVMIDAGIPAADALGKLSNAKNPRVRDAASQVRKGRSLSEALLHTGLVGHYDAELVSIAEASGKVAGELKRAGELQAARQQNIARMKSRMVFSWVVIFIALVCSAAVVIAQNTMTLGQAFTRSLEIAFVVFVLTFLLLRSLRLDSDKYISLGWKLGAQNYSSLYQKYFEYQLYRVIQAQVAAGLDLATSLEKTAGLFSNRDLQQRLRDAGLAASGGTAFIATLRGQGLVLSQELGILLNTADRTGSWDSEMQRFVAMKQRELQDATDVLFTWIPRLYYGFVALMVMRFVI